MKTLSAVLLLTGLFSLHGVALAQKTSKNPSGAGGADNPGTGTNEATLFATVARWVEDLSSRVPALMPTKATSNIRRYRPAATD